MQQKPNVSNSAAHPGNQRERQIVKLPKAQLPHQSLRKPQIRSKTHLRLAKLHAHLQRHVHQAVAAPEVAVGAEPLGCKRLRCAVRGDELLAHAAAHLRSLSARRSGGGGSGSGGGGGRWCGTLLLVHE